MRDPTTARRTHAAPRAGRLLLLGLLAWLAGCGPSPLPSPQSGKTLIVIVRAGPTTWFEGGDGAPAGFDHDLLRRFAREQNLALQVRYADSNADLLARIGAGEAHVGVGGLFAPPPGTGPDPAAPARVLWTQGYYAVEPVLIYNVDGFKPRRFADLADATIVYPEHLAGDDNLERTRREHPDVHWSPVDPPTPDALVAQVSEGTIDYAVVPSNVAGQARNIYLDFDVAFPVGPRREFAWAVAPNQKALRHSLDTFFEHLRKDGTLARYADRYFGTARQVERIDAGVFQDRARSLLPQYRGLFERAQGETGLDWRLVAALAYQESQWDPGATSETGVRGMMQLTEDTAKHLGVADRLDAKAAVLAAARYLQDLKNKLPERIVEPDRTWLALAAFNIGTGHLEDARILAQKQRLNPDLWTDVKKTLPLLAQPEYHVQAKFGYARGGMPVVFVDRVRAYYDILLRTEGAFRPRLRANTTTAAK